MQASVTAERPETLTLLKNDHSTLTQALHNAGLTTTFGIRLASICATAAASPQQQHGLRQRQQSYRPGFARP